MEDFDHGNGDGNKPPHGTDATVSVNPASIPGFAENISITDSIRWKNGYTRRDSESRNMSKKIRIALLAALGFAWPLAANAGGFVYPFDKVSATSCKWNAWSTLGDDCKIDLPKITGAKYSEFEKNQQYRRIYTVLWGATYDYGWDAGLGSHEGVDIATSAGTPVRSIGDGTVVFAGWSNGWGNVVSVKHTLTDKTVIYSNYAHLSKINVKSGQVVLAAENVGEVGNTGNSYGNHLHFQIDTTNQSHPYYFVSCARGLDPMGVVNKGLCRDFLTQNTIDPIAFLESGKVAIPGQASKAVIDAVKARPVEKVDRTVMKTRAQIQEEEIQEFLKKNDISIGMSDNGTNLSVGGVAYATVSSGDSRGKATRGNFPELGLDIAFDAKGLSVFPEKIVALDGGRRDIKITGKKTGAYEVAFKMGQTVIARRTVVVLSPTDAKTAATAEIRTPGTLFLGEDKDVVVFMKTKYGTPLLDSRFDGRFKLSALNGSVKFCNASLDEKTACRAENFANELEFTFDDTYRGALKAKMRAFSFAPVALQLTRIDGRKPVSVTKSKRDTTVANPRGIDNTYPYYYEDVAALGKGYFPLKDGYLLQDREMVGSQAKELVRRHLGYLWLKAGSDFEKKKSIKAAILRFERDF